MQLSNYSIATCCLFFTLILFSATSVEAQNIQLGLSANAGFPRGDFQDNLEDTGFGGEATIGVRLPNAPITFGVNIGYLNYGRTERNEAFNPNIPEVTVRVRTTNNILTGHFFTRFEVPEGLFRPYVEGLIGLNYLFTESSVRDPNNNVNDDIASTTNFDDTALSGGIGGGVKIKLTETSGPGQSQAWFLDFRAKYLLGGEAAYLREGSLSSRNGRLRFDRRQSNTNLLVVGLGFIVEV